MQFRPKVAIFAAAAVIPGKAMRIPRFSAFSDNRMGFGRPPGGGLRPSIEGGNLPVAIAVKPFGNSQKGIRKDRLTWALA